MKTLTLWFIRGVLTTGVAVALIFGGSAVASGSVAECEPHPGYAGTCPPFTEATCNEYCMAEWGNPGHCFADTNCCTCAL
jgi:hypothetical protein